MAFKNKETEKEYYKKYYINNKGKKQKQKAENYQKRKEYIKEWSKIKYLKNKELINNRTREYAKLPKCRYKTLLRTAGKRGYAVDLNFEQFNEIINRPCAYCNVFDLVIGIDRVDNNTGYLFNNCNACCKTCNMMKHSHSVEDFKNQIIKIYKNIIN